MSNEPYTPGVKEDFDRLYRDSYQKVFATAVMMLRDPAAAEDCTQETFVRAFKAWRHWSGETPADAWLHSIVVNVVISWKRKDRVRSLVGGIFGHNAPEVAAPLASPEDATAVVDALRELPSEQAVVVIMRHLHGYSNRDIAKSLGISESTVASRLSAGKAKLRSSLQ